MHLISTAVPNRDWLKFTDRISPSLLPHRSLPRLEFSSVVLSFPVFQGSGKCPKEAGRALGHGGEALWGRWIKGGHGLKGSVWSVSHWDTIPVSVFQTQAVPPSTEPLTGSPEHSLHRSLFSAISLPTPPSPDKPVHSADEESSLSSGTNVWQVNFKVAHGVEATEGYTTVKKEKCCWINSASNGCVTENTLKIQALCIRRQALWFRSRNCEGSLELGLTGVQLLLLEFYDYETCAPVSPI